MRGVPAGGFDLLSNQRIATTHLLFVLPSVSPSGRRRNKPAAAAATNARQMGGVSDVSDSEDSDSTGEQLSPLAPGRLSCRWSSPAQLAGFDKQTPGKTTAGTESLSPQDTWNQDGDNSYFGACVDESWSVGKRGVKALVWDYLPGETSITLAVRLYVTHLDPFVSHEENCAVFLRQASAYRTISCHTVQYCTT